MLFGLDSLAADFFPVSFEQFVKQKHNVDLTSVNIID